MKKCKLCNYSTTVESNLNMHIKTKHTKRTGKAAPQEKKSDVIAPLVQIKQEPTLTVLFNCDFCDYVTSIERNLHIHKKAKHKRKFGCDVCSFEGCNSEDLQKHCAEKHFACSECSFVTGQISLMMEHRNSQHAQVRKTFVCDQCSDFQTSSKAALEVHVMTKHHTPAEEGIFPDQTTEEGEEEAGLAVALFLKWAASRCV